jgi:hypothetical protein
MAHVVDRRALSQREVTCILQVHLYSAAGGWDAEESYSDSDEGGSTVMAGVTLVRKRVTPMAARVTLVRRGVGVMCGEMLVNCVGRCW